MGRGGAIVTWYDRRSGSNYDIYAQRVNALGAVQWTANGVAICAAAWDQLNSTIVSDGAGGAIVTWSDGRNGSHGVYAQRVSASGAVQWTVDGVALCAAAGDQWYPTITSDGASGAIVTWFDLRSGTSWDIYAQRVNALGALQWRANGIALCAAPGAQSYPRIASDGGGGAFVAWNDGRSGSILDIYAQRVNASGAVQWTANGVAICTAASDQLNPAIVSDGAGGVIVTWEDNRRGDQLDFRLDVYAQRVNASGAVQWAADGVALYTAPGGQPYPTTISATSDGTGGAVVTWYDYRSGNFDIYAQRVDTSGAVQWAANGVRLCAATGDQQEPQIISDGLGGAIVVWEDGRGGVDESDVYALRVDANGFAPLTAADAPAVPLELHQNYPNPFNPATTVTYSIPERCNVTLQIYDVSGKRVARLVDRQQEKGSYAVEWSGKDETGSSVASGIYLYKLAAGSQMISKKMVLLR